MIYATRSAKLITLTLAILTMSCSCLSFSPRAAAKTDLSSLGKKSTALDVLETLNKSSKLASYINLDKEDDLPVAVVTGGSSGIGIPSIEALTLANMRVVLCARNLEAAKEAVESLPPSLQANIRIQKLDLSDMESIQAAVDEIVQTETKVDVLLNNAGVMATPKRESTKQGLELQFGTNHVGHHMLTRKLLPSMNSEGRVVTVASTAHSFGQLDFGNLNYDDDKTKPERSYTAWGAYGQSKLANVLFAKGLNDKLKSEGSSIISLSLHPGVIGTNLWRHTPKWTKPFLNALVADRTIDQGAATNVYGCLVDANMLGGGEYLLNCNIAEPNQYGKDENKTLREKLWDATEAIIEKNGFKLPENVIAEAQVTA